MLNIILIFAISVVIFGVLLAFSLIKKINKSKWFTLGIKIAAGVMFAFITLRGFLNDKFITQIKWGYFEGRLFNETDIPTAILRWIQYTSFFVTTTAVFYNNRIFKNIAKYVFLPFNIVNTCFVNKHLSYFLEESNVKLGTIRGITLPGNVRTPLVLIEFILLLVVGASLFLMDAGKKNYSLGKEITLSAVYTPVMIALTPPTYIFQSIWGFTSEKMDVFGVYHFIWFAVLAVLMIAIYFLYRLKDKDTRWSVIAFLSFYLFVHYNTIYLMDFVAARLPLQLCNLGAYLILAAVIFKNQKFFDFVFIANVIGALIAIFAVDVSNNLLSFWTIHYTAEHTWVFLLPLLMVALRLYKLPNYKEKALLHFFIGFTIYFAVCWAGGFVFNCYAYDPTTKFLNRVNYFYIYNTTVVEAFPFLGFTRLVKATVNGYEFYPIYQLVIYGGYMAGCVAFYFLILFLQGVAKRHFEARKIRIRALEEKGFYKKLHLQVPALEYANDEEEVKTND